jgi:hypothetical protein
LSKVTRNVEFRSFYKSLKVNPRSIPFAWLVHALKWAKALIATVKQLQGNGTTGAKNLGTRVYHEPGISYENLSYINLPTYSL